MGQKSQRSSNATYEICAKLLIKRKQACTGLRVDKDMSCELTNRHKAPPTPTSHIPEW